MLNTGMCNCFSAFVSMFKTINKLNSDVHIDIIPRQNNYEKTQ